jgi:hypothetical protein
MGTVRQADARFHDDEILRRLPHRAWAELRETLAAAWSWELGPRSKLSITLEELMEDLSHGRD